MAQSKLAILQLQVLSILNQIAPLRGGDHLKLHQPFPPAIVIIVRRRKPSALVMPPNVCNDSNDGIIMAPL